jgi:hypothetical protein
MLECRSASRCQLRARPWRRRFADLAMESQPSRDPPYHGGCGRSSWKFAQWQKSPAARTFPRRLRPSKLVSAGRPTGGILFPSLPPVTSIGFPFFFNLTRQLPRSETATPESPQLARHPSTLTSCVVRPSSQPLRTHSSTYITPRSSTSQVHPSHLLSTRTYLIRKLQPVSNCLAFNWSILAPFCKRFHSAKVLRAPFGSLALCLSSNCMTDAKSATAALNSPQPLGSQPPPPRSRTKPHVRATD